MNALEKCGSGRWNCDVGGSLNLSSAHAESFKLSFAILFPPFSQRMYEFGPYVDTYINSKNDHSKLKVLMEYSWPFLGFRSPEMNKVSLSLNSECL